MIKEIKIENFKSIESLNLELGRLNVFIGANGSGKSNILEAIAFGSAAAVDKLDNEFLAPRGIRSTEPDLMKSAFKLDSIQNNIKIAFQDTLDEFVILSILDKIKWLVDWRKSSFRNKYANDLKMNEHFVEEEGAFLDDLPNRIKEEKLDAEQLLNQELKKPSNRKTDESIL
jgi:predicted ATPase